MTWFPESGREQANELAESWSDSHPLDTPKEETYWCARSTTKKNCLQNATGDVLHALQYAAIPSYFDRVTRGMHDQFRQTCIHNFAIYTNHFELDLI